MLLLLRREIPRPSGRTSPPGREGMGERQLLEVHHLTLEAKAKELAEVLKETEEYKELNSAQTRVKLDPEADDLLKRLQNAQQQLQNAQAEGQQIQPEQVQEYQDLESQIRTNLTLTNLLKAQQSFGEVMNRVQETISEELF